MIRYHTHFSGGFCWTFSCRSLQPKVETFLITRKFLFVNFLRKHFRIWEFRLFKDNFWGWLLQHVQFQKLFNDIVGYCSNYVVEHNFEIRFGSVETQVFVEYLNWLDVSMAQSVNPLNADLSSARCLEYSKWGHHRHVSDVFPQPCSSGSNMKRWKCADISLHMSSKTIAAKVSGRIESFLVLVWRGGFPKLVIKIMERSEK